MSEVNEESMHPGMRTSRLGRVPAVLMAILLPVLLLQACSNEQEAAEATAPTDGNENAQANAEPESATPAVVAEEAEARPTLLEEPVLNYGERQDALQVGAQRFAAQIEGREHAFDSEAPEDWQSEARSRLWSSLTLPNGESWDDHPLEIQGGQRLEGYRGNLTLAQVHYAAADQYVAELYLLSPDCSQAHCRPVLLIPGHSNLSAHSMLGIQNSPGDELQYDAAVEMAQAGYQVFVPHLRGFFTTTGDYNLGHLQLYRQFRGRGIELLGILIEDVYHALRVARTIKSSDQEVAVAGISLGGNIALYLGALEPSIPEVVVVGFFGSFSQALVLGNQCSCGFIEGLPGQLELYEIAGMVAPRTLRILAGTEDQIFPVEIARSSLVHTQSIYEALGTDAPDHGLHYLEWDGGHVWDTPSVLQLLAP